MELNYSMYTIYTKNSQESEKLEITTKYNEIIFRVVMNGDITKTVVWDVNDLLKKDNIHMMLSKILVHVSK